MKNMYLVRRAHNGRIICRIEANSEHSALTRAEYHPRFHNWDDTPGTIELIDASEHLDYPLLSDEDNLVLGELSREVNTLRSKYISARDEYENMNWALRRIGRKEIEK